MGQKPRQRAGSEESYGPAPRLYQLASKKLSEQIRSGELAAGSPLSETTVAARFGISRAPARRALAELAGAGLLERDASGRGFVVRHGATARGSRKRAGNDEPVEPAQDLRLVSESSWQRIYREVEAELAARISFASWRLNEAELARRYRVSRTVAREVIARLQQSGIVRKDDHGRWLAPALTPQLVGELYELRSLLEPTALTKAAARLPPGLLEEMRRELEAALAAEDEVPGDVLDGLEKELHVTLLGHCGSETLMRAITLPQSLLIAHRFLYRWTARMFEKEPFLPEHLDIVRKLQEGHVEEAAQALEDHLRVSGDRAIARIAAITSGPQPEQSTYLEQLPD